MHDEYRALLRKVEGFTEATSARRHQDLTCKKGCSACCETWLTLSPVEAAYVRLGVAALPPEKRAQVAARGRRERAREARGEAPSRCALLEEDGSCVVYEHRPLVCRTQGHALRYPEGFIPEEAVRGRVPNGEITYCPLNYANEKPLGADVLDAGRVDELLAVVNLRFAQATHADPARRESISALAAEADMLGCQGSK